MPGERGKNLLVCFCCPFLTSAFIEISSSAIYWIDRIRNEKSSATKSGRITRQMILRPRQAFF
ncbi:hypothetical protein B0H10DRAFT_1993978 [Mycena sp. CBHHK59/15]|nr:hypothetical protein B0H10DRAFT_1993978 [Mycena sp. CBHHK59/15]